MLLYWILLPIIWVLAHILFRFETFAQSNEIFIFYLFHHCQKNPRPSLHFLQIKFICPDSGIADPHFFTDCFIVLFII